MRPLLLAVAATTLLLGSACSSAEAPAGTATAEATQAVTATPTAGEQQELPPLNAFDDQMSARLREIRDEIASMRGLPPNEDMDEGWLSRDVFAAWMEAEFAAITDEERQEIEAFNIALRLMHLISPEVDLLEEFAKIYVDGVLGMWLPEESSLLLLSTGALRDRDVVTLAHEYVHSFQAAAFQAFDEGRWKDLTAPEDEGLTNTEYATTISCVYEGDASLAGMQYAEAQFGDRWPIVYYGLDGSMAVAAAGDTPPAPALARYMSFDYAECPGFVQSIFQEGGWEAVNALYERPPATTEQVLHPEKYVQGELASGLSPVELRLGGSWERLDLATFGEFDVYNYLLSAMTPDSEVRRALESARALAASGQVTPEQAAELRALDEASVLQEAALASAVAAEGWGAGWLSVYRGGATEDPAGQDLFVHISLEWDTLDDLWEFLAVYERVINVKSDYSFDLVTERGPARWTGAVGHGELSWDEATRRADILLATSAPVLEAASGLLVQFAASR